LLADADIDFLLKDILEKKYNGALMPLEYYFFMEHQYWSSFCHNDLVFGLWFMCLMSFHVLSLNSFSVVYKGTNGLKTDNIIDCVVMNGNYDPK